MPIESHILKHSGDRSKEFRPNQKLDALIATLSSILAPAETSTARGFVAPRLPVIAVLGCPRSGTTFLTQLLASSGQFFYPSNFLSRFAYAPYIGTLIQQMLFDPLYDVRGELKDIKPLAPTFSSNVGKTDGALGINEFFHFWRRFFPNHDPGHLSPAELSQVDIASLRGELAAIESVYGKPFMAKAMMLQYNVRHFAREMPELFFVYIKRTPIYNMQSIAEARRRYYQREDIWWSVKPKEYQILKDMDFFSQVAGQVYFTENAISTQLHDVEPARKIVSTYESLCASPALFFTELVAKLEARGTRIEVHTDMPERFSCENSLRLPAEELEKLQLKYDWFNKEYGSER